MRQKTLLLAALTLWCHGTCAPTPHPQQAPDAGAPADAAPALQVRVGTGPPGTFAEPGAGAPLLLQRGCQGSQHIFIAVRVRGAQEGPLRVTVTIRRRSDQQPVAVPLDVRLPAEEDPQEVGALRITGLTPVIEVPREALGQEVTVSALVRDEAERGGWGALVGVVQWGTDSCAGPPPGPSLRANRGPLEDRELLLWLGLRAAGR